MLIYQQSLTHGFSLTVTYVLQVAGDATERKHYGYRICSLLAITATYRIVNADHILNILVYCIKCKLIIPEKLLFKSTFEAMAMKTIPVSVLAYRNEVQQLLNQGIYFDNKPKLDSWTDLKLSFQMILYCKGYIFYLSFSYGMISVVDSSKNLQSTLSVNAPEFVPRKVCSI